MTEILRLTAADDADIDALGRLAFGDRAAPGSGVPELEWAGMSRWGVRDGSGRLVAKITDRRQGQWFGGRSVTTSGIAGVAVRPEARGAGLAQQLVRAALQHARERGAVLSTLFRTAPGLYRRLGYEQAGLLSTWALPTAALSTLRVPPGISVRAATEADLHVVQEVYTSVARAANGYLDRTGPLFEWAGRFAGLDGITLAYDASGGVQGYCGWVRGAGYDATARITAKDLLATTGEATTALLATLGTWASVTGTTVLRVPAHDPVHLLVPTAGIRPETADPWMVCILDAPAAVAARGWPPGLSGSVHFELVDENQPHNAGPARLVVADGEARLEPGGRGSLQLHARGLAVLYAGNADPAVLRRAGLVSGGEQKDDDVLRLAFAGPAPAINDYF